MSFGCSISDITLLVQLAYKTTQGAKAACGEYDELTRETSTLHVTLDRLHKEVLKPQSPINRRGESYRQELDSISSGCEVVLTRLDKILVKYNALSEQERSARRLWKQVRFVSGVVDVSELRAKVTYYTSALWLFLNIVSLGTTGEIERKMDEAGGDLKDIKVAVNSITARLMATSREEGSVLTTYANDDKGAWRELRRGLIEAGFRGSLVREHMKTIMAYVTELGDRRVLDSVSTGEYTNAKDADNGEEPRAGGQNHHVQVDPTSKKYDQGSQYKQTQTATGDDTSTHRRSGALNVNTDHIKSFSPQPPILKAPDTVSHEPPTALIKPRDNDSIFQIDMTPHPRVVGMTNKSTSSDATPGFPGSSAEYASALIMWEIVEGASLLSSIHQLNQRYPGLRERSLKAHETEGFVVFTLGVPEKVSLDHDMMMNLKHFQAWLWPFEGLLRLTLKTSSTSKSVNILSMPLSHLWRSDIREEWKSITRKEILSTLRTFPILVIWGTLKLLANLKRRLERLGAAISAKCSRSEFNTIDDLSIADALIADFIREYVLTQTSPEAPNKEMQDASCDISVYLEKYNIGTYSVDLSRIINLTKIPRSMPIDYAICVALQS